MRLTPRAKPTGSGPVICGWRTTATSSPPPRWVVLERGGALQQSVPSSLQVAVSFSRGYWREVGTGNLPVPTVMFPPEVFSALFVGFTATMAESDFSCPCIIGLRLFTFPMRTVPRTRC